MAPVVIDRPQRLKEMVGREIGVTEWFLVAQERIERFAEATEDRQWIHVDSVRASKESPYGTTIAHGFLTLSLISRFVQEAIQDSRRSAAGGELRIEPRALSGGGAGGFQYPRTCFADEPEGTAGCGGSDVRRDDGVRRIG